MARSKSRGGAPSIRDMPFEAEAVEQRLLHHPPSAHHRPNLLHPAEEKSAPGAPIKQSFSGQFAHSGRLESTSSGHSRSGQWMSQLGGKGAFGCSSGRTGVRAKVGIDRRTNRTSRWVRKSDIPDPSAGQAGCVDCVQRTPVRGKGWDDSYRRGDFPRAYAYDKSLHSWAISWH